MAVFKDWPQKRLVKNRWKQILQIKDCWSGGCLARLDCLKIAGEEFFKWKSGKKFCKSSLPLKKSIKIYLILLGTGTAPPIWQPWGHSVLIGRCGCFVAFLLWILFRCVLLDSILSDATIVWVNLWVAALVAICAFKGNEFIRYFTRLSCAWLDPFLLCGNHVKDW